jgi:hypothetical protein
MHSAAAAGSGGTYTNGGKGSKPPENVEIFGLIYRVQNLYFNHTTVIYPNEYLMFWKHRLRRITHEGL